MQNQSLGVFFDAPSWRDPDFFAFLLLQRVFGNFTSGLHTENIMDLKSQGNMMHNFCGTVPDLEQYDAIYSPYSDCGIFGHYFNGDPRFTQQMSYLGGNIGEIFSEYLNDEEVTRAKYKLYSELLSVQAASDVMQQYGPQLLHLERKITRAEIAERVSAMDARYLQTVCKKWFVDREPSITSWGPID